MTTVRSPLFIALTMAIVQFFEADAAVLEFSPYSPAETATDVVWTEAGFQMEGDWFGSHESTDTSYQGGFWPTNGTDFMRFLRNGSAVITTTSGQPFDAISIDLAEYSQAFQFPADIAFIGVRENGSEITTSFTLDGIITGPDEIPDFETFEFPAEFVSIQELRIPSGTFNMDNFVLNTVPEPAAPVLVIATGAALLCRRRRRGRPFTPANS